MYGERLLSGEQQSGIDDSDVDSRHPSLALPVEGERTKTVYFFLLRAASESFRGLTRGGWNS